MLCPQCCPLGAPTLQVSVGHLLPQFPCSLALSSINPSLTSPTVLSQRKLPPCCCSFVPKTQLTITGHGCADPVPAGTDTAVTLHLGLGSICIRFILQGTLCWDPKSGATVKREGRTGSLGYRLCTFPISKTRAVCASEALYLNKCHHQSKGFLDPNLDMATMGWSPVSNQGREFSWQVLGSSINPLSSLALHNTTPIPATPDFLS